MRAYPRQLISSASATNLDHARGAESNMGLHYKVVELGTVTDESIETTLNEWTRQGWSFENIQFAMRESSKRPSMAFVTFSREIDDDEPAQ